MEKWAEGEHSRQLGQQVQRPWGRKKLSALGAVRSMQEDDGVLAPTVLLAWGWEAQGGHLGMPLELNMRCWGRAVAQEKGGGGCD